MVAWEPPLRCLVHHPILNYPQPPLWITSVKAENVLSLVLFLEKDPRETEFLYDPFRVSFVEAGDLRHLAVAQESLFPSPSGGVPYDEQEDLKLGHGERTHDEGFKELVLYLRIALFRRGGVFFHGEKAPFSGRDPRTL